MKLRSALLACVLLCGCGSASSSVKTTCTGEEDGLKMTVTMTAPSKDDAVESAVIHMELEIPEEAQELFAALSEEDLANAFFAEEDLPEGLTKDDVRVTIADGLFSADINISKDAMSALSDVTDVTDEVSGSFADVVSAMEEAGLSCS